MSLFTSSNDKRDAIKGMNGGLVCKGFGCTRSILVWLHNLREEAFRNLGLDFNFENGEAIGPIMKLWVWE